ncbi:MAG TPA: ABC transporter permease, partial [Acidobacteriota bacterium]|nr:ABC transporter permease [Acidobacteriota bacterium]
MNPVIILYDSIGLGLILSIFNVFLRDLPNIVTVVFSALFYATPVIYSVDRFPENLQMLFKLNPLLYFINLSRLVILGGQAIHFWDWMIPILIDLV